MRHTFMACPATMWLAMVVPTQMAIWKGVTSQYPVFPAAGAMHAQHAALAQRSVPATHGALLGRRIRHRPCASH